MISRLSIFPVDCPVGQHAIFIIRHIQNRSEALIISHSVAETKTLFFVDFIIDVHTSAVVFIRVIHCAERIILEGAISVGQSIFFSLSPASHIEVGTE